MASKQKAKTSESKSFSISNGKSVPMSIGTFAAIKNVSLGTSYSLSLNFVSPGEIKKLNLIYRGKKTATDILSFPLSKKQGEIYICLSEARKEAKKFDRSFANFIAFLFIHGCVHLKGYDHGGTMESIEKSFEANSGFDLDSYKWQVSSCTCAAQITCNLLTGNL